MELKRYVGAYGVLVREDSLLLVRKTRGPYTGTLDLPGGGIEHGEAPAFAVEREFFEETGLRVRPAGLLPPFSYVTGNQHHLGFCFAMELMGDPAALKTEPDGQDAGGALWVPLSQLKEHWLSPLVEHGLRYLGR